MRNRASQQTSLFLKCLPATLVITSLTFVSQVSAQDLPADVRDRLKKAAGQVASGIKVQGEDKVEVFGWGSGWFVNSTGLMVTNDHVVNRAHYSEDPMEAFRVRVNMGIIQYRVTLNGGTEDERTYKGELMYQSESGDLALLQVKDDDGGQLRTPYFLKLLPSKDVEEGMRVAIVGYPQGQQMATSRDKHAPVTITTGNIDRIVRASSGRIKKFFSDAQATRGNSGGPCVDFDGNLVGVLVEGGVDPSMTTGVASGVIPADIVGDMIKAALGLNKLETDLAPFLNLLVGKDLRVFVPGRERLPGKDIVEFPDGEELQGDVTDTEMTWNTPVGNIVVPIELAGYAINNDGTARLLLDGGERLVAPAADVEFNFKDRRGNNSRMKMSNLRSVLFRKHTSPIKLPDVVALVVEGKYCKLLLTDIEGEVAFEDESAGRVTMELDQIRKVTSRHFKQELYRIDGSRLTGKFLPHTLKANLALSGASIEFSLERAEELSTDFVNPSKIYDRQVPLAMRLQIDDAELEAIASYLDADDWKKAGALLDEIIDPSVFKSKEKPVQSQIEALYAEYQLREGNYEEATDWFKNARKSKIVGVKWYCTGRYEVLDVYETGEFNGAALSDPEVFKKAAWAMSSETMASAREIMDAYGKAQIAKYSDWRRIEGKASRMEKDLQVASSLILGEAERTMFQMWQFRQRTNWAALNMLFSEREKLSTEIQTRRASGKSINSIVRKLDKINSNIQTVLIKYGELRSMMNPIGNDSPGYRVDDPDAADYLRFSRFHPLAQ